MAIKSESAYTLPDSDLRQYQVKSQSEMYKKFGSAVFYAIASFLLTIFNKNVLSIWHFPSFLMISIGQLIFTFAILSIGKYLQLITYPNFSIDIPRKIMPLPFLYFGNKTFGLGGTQAMSLPMFTALRRFAILLTMLLEFKILGVWPSRDVQISVLLMVGGAVLAAGNDLSFTPTGYGYVMSANLITAAYGVFLKEKLDTLEIGKYGIMFYNSLLMIGPAIVIAWMMGDLKMAAAFPHWFNPMFTLQFLITCILGFVLTFSVILCTEFNSALTTAMVGCLKNVFVSYIGMFFGGDYQFSWLNCIALNISVFGSIYYAYVIFVGKDQLKKLEPQDT